MKLAKILILVFAVLLAPTLFLINCKNYPGKDSREIMRVPSPDSVVEAYVTENGGGGATSGFTYSLYIVPKGVKKDKYDSSVLLIDRVDGLRIEWIKPKLLAIRFAHGRVFDFCNFWQSPDINNYNYTVELQINSDGSKTYYP